MTGNGDFGRRISYRRHLLGLTPEQVADRADMSAGYVQHLEGHLGTPDPGTVTRLATALETTAEDLLGGGHDRPPGPGPGPEEPVLEVLDREECLRLVASGGIGRVAFSGRSGPTVLPVNFRFHEGAVVFRTAYGGPMDQDLRSGVKGVDIKIGFQVDRIDEARQEGWSVLIQGPAHHVPQDEVERAAEAGVTSWAGGPRALHIRVVPHQITGRRIHGL